MLHAVEEFLLLRFLCDSKKMKPAVGPGPDGFDTPWIFHRSRQKKNRRTATTGGG
jgi:hypothetical protein